MSRTPQGGRNRRAPEGPPAVDDEQILVWGRDVLHQEARGIAALVEYLGPDFVRAVRIIHRSQGRLIVTGVGKSGLIGHKIAATMTSTGSLASFMHPTDALHGDVGMVRRGDVLLALSKSGETAELDALIPLVRAFDVPVIAITGTRASRLGQQSDLTLEIGPLEEACNMDLVPTTSTTATLALGDALAVALLQLRGFGPEEFRQLHPGGAIGRALLKVEDLMHTGEEIPIVPLGAPAHQVLLEMTSKRLGATLVVDEEDRLRGIITDGDLRRSLERDFDLGAVIAADLMTLDPKTIDPQVLGVVALNRMEEHKITQLAIVDEAGRPYGILHLHDLLNAKVV
jgi:arabinose-5-phosphate isomerase